MVWVSCCDSTGQINRMDQWHVCWDMQERAWEKDLLIASNCQTTADLVFMDTHTHTHQPAGRDNRSASTPQKPTQVQPDLDFSSLGWIFTCVGPTVTQTKNDPRGALWLPLCSGFRGGASIDWTCSGISNQTGAWGVERLELFPLCSHDFLAGLGAESRRRDFTYSMGGFSGRKYDPYACVQASHRNSALCTKVPT